MAETTSKTETRKFCLRHLNHESMLNNQFYSMLQEQSMVDVMLSCEGVGVKAHRLVLSANSNYFKNIFSQIPWPTQYPVIVLKDVAIGDLKIIIEFMYKGVAFIEENQLQSVLKSAEALNVSGLTDVCQKLKKQLGYAENKRPRIDEQNKEDERTSATRKEYEINPASKERGLTLSPPQTNLKSGSSNAFGQLPSPKFPGRRPNAPKLIPQTTTTSPLNRQLTRSLLPRPAKNGSEQDSPSKTFEQSMHSSVDLVTSSSKNIMHPANATQSKSTARKSISSTLSSKSATQSSPPLHPPELTPAESIRNNRLIITKPNSDVPIEVTLDDENLLVYHSDEEEEDVKPSIFELCENRSNLISTMNSDNNELPKLPPLIRRGSRSSIDSNEETRSVRSSGSRSSTASGIKPPPPPSFRVVQRSSARSLRTILKTPAELTQRVEEKGRSTKSKVKQPENDIDSPEIECPSCGLKFDDEKKWNHHIQTEHVRS